MSNKWLHFTFAFIVIFKNESDIISNMIIVYKHISEYRYLFKKPQNNNGLLVFKAGPQHLISNYHPIAILPVIEKSFERCVFQNLQYIHMKY